MTTIPTQRPAGHPARRTRTRPPGRRPRPVPFPTVQVGSSEVGVCESCRQQPATHIWPRPEAGAPFQLCESCWSATTRQGAEPGRCGQDVGGRGEKR